MRRERSALVALLALASFSTAAPGQVTIDGRLSPAQTLTGPLYTIPQSLGAVRGTNLFHSFGQFSLSPRETANFVSSGMTNIIARVTGGDPSSIDGRLQALQSGVNLYLINPGGIRFGPNARLEVGGSFYASTANYLKLADGGRFDASKPAASVLTAAAPAAFGFLGSNPASIAVNGSVLVVPTGRALGLIGGDIEITGAGLFTNNGAVHLVAAGSAGEAKIRRGAYDVSSFARLGNVSISESSGIFVNDCCGATSGGAIHVRGGELVMDESLLLTGTGAGSTAGNIDVMVTGDITLANRALIRVTTAGSGKAGGINIVADGAMHMSGSLVTSTNLGSGRGVDIDVSARGGLALDSASAVTTIAAGNGAAGDIRIRTSDLALRDGSLIHTRGSAAPFQGRGGDIDIAAGNQITADHSYILSSVAGTANGGDIRIRADGITFRNGASIDSDGVGGGTGRRGDILLVARGDIAFDGSNINSGIGGRGDAGSIEIRSRGLALTGGTNIFSTAGPFGPGRGGNILIRTSELSIDDGFISSATLGTGNGGNIDIFTGTMTLRGSVLSGAFLGATGRGGDVRITARSLSVLDAHIHAPYSGIETSTLGSGNAGHLVVHVDHLTLAPGAYVNAGTSGTGHGGNVIVSATSGISIGSGGEISATSTGSGNAGSITVNAGSRLILDGGLIRTATLRADGGDIHVVARDLVYLNGGTISSSVQGGAGNGGNIFIDPTFVVLNRGGSIIANAFEGNGGNILIHAGHLLQSAGSVISASSQLGISGNVVISSPFVDLSGGLVTLPASYLDASSLLTASCAARIAGKAGSFVVAGRGGIPTEPDTWLTGLGDVAPTTPMEQIGPAAIRSPMFAWAAARGCAR